MIDFRQEFQQLLEKTFISANSDKERIVFEMISFLNKIIPNIPDHLFRYRRLDAEKHMIESFEKGTITLCKAKCFSDKYDSMTFVDAEKVVKGMENDFKDAILHVINSIKEKDPNVYPDKAARLCYYLEQGMTDKEVAERVVKEDYSNLLMEVRMDLKQKESRFRDSEKTARIACFTESVQSKFMWDTYADGYSGFALEYNLKEFAINCFNNCKPAYVFPVIYTNERPDLTIDEANYYVFEEFQKRGWLHKLEPYRLFLDLNILSPHKPFLYKDKEEYTHEREWRILYYDEKAGEDYLELPDQGCLKAVYYGPDIKKEDYESLHEIALKKGIKEYRVSIDNNSRKYSLMIEDADDHVCL